MVYSQNISNQMNDRRQEIGLSISALARLSGLNRNTVRRALQSPAHERVSTLLAIANVLGVSIGVTHPRTISAVRKDRAKSKAIEIVEMAQGNFALEGQAVSDEEERRIIRKVAERLLSGKNIRLWS